MNYLKNTNIINNLKKSFPDISFELKTYKIGVNIPIFFIRVDNEINLSHNWEKINNYIASHFQIYLNTEYETWNIYLFFLLDKMEDISLKYKIENDKFSSRKIIIINPPKNYDDIVEECLFDNKLFIQKDKSLNNSALIFNKNNIIEKALKNRTVRNNRINKSIAEEVLNDISKYLKHELK
jgi:hypothetical protein